MFTMFNITNYKSSAINFWKMWSTGDMLKLKETKQITIGSFSLSHFVILY